MGSLVDITDRINAKSQTEFKTNVYWCMPYTFFNGVKPDEISKPIVQTDGRMRNIIQVPTWGLLMDYLTYYRASDFEPHAITMLDTFRYQWEFMGDAKTNLDLQYGSMKYWKFQYDHPLLFYNEQCIHIHNLVTELMTVLRKRGSEPQVILYSSDMARLLENKLLEQDRVDTYRQQLETAISAYPNLHIVEREGLGRRLFETDFVQATQTFIMILDVLNAVEHKT